MDVGGSSLPDSINPNNFPAKLWRLVNNPANEAINWDSQGEGIVIDQRLFERQILSPSNAASYNADAFKTTHFSSFVRQLNLYGFRKASPASKDNHHPGGDSGRYGYFYNPNFKRNHPELLATMRRLTADKKANVHAGENVNSSPTPRQRFSGGDDGRDKNGKRGTSSLLGPTHRESTPPCNPNKVQAMTGCSGTPVPPRYLIRGHDAALSPPVFATDKGIPISLRHHYTEAASSSNAAHIQQGLLAHAKHGNPNFAIFDPFNAQYQPGYCPPVFQCYQPNLVASHLTGSGLQTGSFSPQSYYQARYPVNIFCQGGHNQHPQNKEHQEVQKRDVNLETVFQIADNVMHALPNSCLVRVVTPEKPGPVLVRSFNTMLSDNPASAMQANPSCAGPIVMAVLGKKDLVKLEQQEEFVLSVPEQMPEDAFTKVTSDDANDTEVIEIEVSDSVKDTSQAHNSSCTGGAPNL